MEIANPLKQYSEEFEPQFIEASNRMFQELAARAKVDVTANHATCSEISKLTQLSKFEGRRTTWLWVAFVTMCVASIALICICFISNSDAYWRIGSAISALGLVCLLILKTYPAIKASRGRKKELEDETETLKKQAWKQMSPLNNLYSDDIFPKLFTQVIPLVIFNSYMSEADYRDLAANYGFYEYGKNRSMLSLQSGRLNGNPIVIRRYKDFVMRQRTYYGSKTVTVTATEYRDGKNVTVRKQETIKASVTKPYPEFPVNTEVIYANLAAPDLTFHRHKNTFKNKVGSIAYAFNKRSLKKKSRNMKQDFALMTNEEFEVLFTTTDRNSNQQFSLLFTPVAQANMIDLIRDEHTGYGDDFDFQKERCINTIVADHLHNVDLDWTSYKYKTYDFEAAEHIFLQENLQLFKAIYFGFAPLFCVPLYQQMRPAQELVRYDSPSCRWEHERYANHLGVGNFAHPSCVTDCILKTESLPANEINVTAYGFRSVHRVDYVSVRSSDGRSHQVAVDWEEYIPVIGTGIFEMPY